ncbi:hypothetical protein MMC10_006649 [Thelotrema lepadinum]|nr:hypothetical protein [Thelotrema lepadinum]
MPPKFDPSFQRSSTQDRPFRLSPKKVGEDIAKATGKQYPRTYVPKARSGRAGFPYHMPDAPINDHIEETAQGSIA